MGWAVRRVALWGGIALALVTLANHGIPFGALHLGFVPAKAPAPGRPAATATPAAAATGSLSYRADARGHVLLDAAVNGAAVRFLVDTGASLVILCPADARAIGLNLGQLDFNQSAATANGQARMAPVILRELRIQQFTAYDVPAAVVERLDISLLGMSFLKQLQSYEMRDGTLTLTW
jgi:aspartyl protease family protein